MAVPNKQAVGAHFDLESMRYASVRSWRAVDAMREVFVPGLRESDARRLGKKILVDHGMERIWHPVVVRFGANTTKIFRDKSDGDSILGDDDIYFIDIGPVFRGHEGDVGATFTTGGDAEKIACAAAVKTLFDEVSDVWRNDRVCGPELYAEAARRATNLGYILNLDVKGHRVGDYPHAIHRGGSLRALHEIPVAGAWVLEMQILHPSRAFGAFYEDVLV